MLSRFLDANGSHMGKRPYCSHIASKQEALNPADSGQPHLECRIGVSSRSVLGGEVAKARATGDHAALRSWAFLTEEGESQDAKL